MNNIVIVLNKTNKNEIFKDLISCVLTYDFLCLSKTQKWCSEMLFSLQNNSDNDNLSFINDDSFKFNSCDLVHTKDIVRFQLARSFFNQKEYLRASNYLTEYSSNESTSTTTSTCYFMYIYSKYMSIMKKCVDNKADLFNNTDPTNLDQLQGLRNQLNAKYYNKSTTTAAASHQLDAFSLYVYGIVLSKLKLTDEAIHVLVEAVKKRPSLWCAWLELANLIKSIETLNSLNNSNGLPQHWMKDLFMAQCFMELSLSEEAVNIYTIYSNKGFAKSLYIKSQLAKCYDNLREGQLSKQTFEEIRKLDPFNLDFMDIYSNILFVLEEYAQLSVLAQEACEIDKYKPESCCIIGNYYSLQNEHHKAVNYFQRALKLNPTYLQAWTLMGHEFMELKNSTSAIQSYTNAIEHNPKDYRAWYGLGQTYEILKSYSYSLYYYKQAYLLRPNDSRFIVALADVYVKLEKWDEAKRCYIKAYTIGDYEGAALCKLAKVYEKLNEPINVAIAYDQFTEDQKLQRRTNTTELSQAYKFLANFYLKKMKLDNAYEAATKCLEFPETRQEAQSLLNQIAQTRNSIRESEQTSTISPLNPLLQQQQSTSGQNKVINNNNIEMDIGQTIEIKSESSSKLPNIEIDQKIDIDSKNNESSSVQILELSSDSSSDTASESAHEESTGDFNIKRFSHK